MKFSLFAFDVFVFGMHSTHYRCEQLNMNGETNEKTTIFGFFVMRGTLNLNIVIIFFYTVVTASFFILSGVHLF